MQLSRLCGVSLDKVAAISVAVTIALSGALVGCGGDDGESSPGTGASGGTGGTAGTTGGTGGTAGTTGGTGGGGTGGVSGSGGFAGSAGSGGVAGQSGAAGMAGQGGTAGQAGGSGSGGAGGQPQQACDTPTFNPVAGTYTGAQNVAISTTTSGATIYYTTDGTQPTTSSKVYSSEIAVSVDTTIRAMCNSATTTNSQVAVASYVIQNAAVEAPSFNPTASVQNNDFLLALTTTTAGATICFTLDGSTPSCSNGSCQGSAQTYNGQTQIPINGNVTNPATGEVTVNAIACKANAPSSTSLAQKYTLQVATPKLAGPDPGQYDYTNTSLTPLLSTATTGTVNALYSTSASNLPSCTTGLPVTGNLPTSWNISESSGNQTFYFAACKAGYKGSDVYTASYDFKLAQPTFNPAGGDYDKTQNVAVTNPNAGVSNDWLCTTSDGSAPACGTTQGTCGGTGVSGGTVGVLTDGTSLKSIVCGSSPAFVTSDAADSGAYNLDLDPIEFTPPNGTPVNAGTGQLAVTIDQDTTGGAGQTYSFICWSVDGTTPDCTCTAAGLTKTSGNSVSVPAASVTAGTTIKAIACDDGSSPAGSALAPASGSATYPSAAQMATPSIDPSGSTQNDWVSVEFTNNDATRTALVCYTTDGSTPTPTATCGAQGTTSCTTSLAVGASTTVDDLVKSTNVTVKAVACDVANPHMKSDSAVATQTYQLKVDNPALSVASPAPGSVPVGSSIAWGSATTKATVTFFYTTDGSTPSCAGGGTTSVGTSYHMVDASKTTIKVIACAPMMTPSDVITWTYSYYVEPPALTPGSGTYNDYPLVQFTNSPTDSTFACITFDGSTPTCNASACGFGSTQLTPAGYYVVGSGTIKAVACYPGLASSSIASATYALEVGAIQWSPDPATTYSTPKSVTFSVSPDPDLLLGVNIPPVVEYDVCWVTGSVSVPQQPATCAGLGTYLNTNTGASWSCVKDTGGPYQVLPNPIADTTTVTAVACKTNMVWSTSQKTYTFNPYSHTIVIDGANDFTAGNEAISTSVGGDTAYLSWDADNIYLGYKGYSPLSGETVDVYFGDGVQGTTSGDPIGPLPVNALYHLMWKNTSGTTAVVRKWTPGSPGSWGDDTSVVVSVGWTGGAGYDYVELSISRTAIGDPSVLAMFGGLLDATNSSYVAIWPPTASNYYELQLLASTVPNASTIK